MIAFLFLALLLIVLYAGGFGWLAGKLLIALHILTACALPSVVVLAIVVVLVMIVIVALA